MNARITIRLSLLAWVSLASAAQAQAIEIKLGAGNLVGVLGQDASTHAYAMLKAVHAMKPTLIVNHKTIDAIDNRSFRNRLHSDAIKATIARIDYRSNATGKRISVHARSGSSFARTINKFIDAKGTDSSGSTTEAGAVISPGEAVMDARSAAFYPSSEVDIRASNLLRRDIWVVEPSKNADGRITHGTDAELKAMRQLEMEFERDPTLVSAGGTMTGYVSKTVCHSCRQAFETFSEHYGVDGTVYELTDQNIPETATIADAFVADIDAASGAASRVLFDLRKEIGRAAFVPGRPAPLPGSTRWSEELTADRLAAAEAGSLAASEACDAE